MPDLVTAEDFTTRQKFVNVAPALLLIGIVQTLIVAGTPKQAPDVYRLIRRLDDYGWVGVAVLVVGAVLLALLLEPLELATIRFMEGYWNSFGYLAPMAELGVWIQSRRRARMRWITREVSGGEEASTASRKLDDLPRLWPLLPTSLGNALRAMEERAGSPYGLDALSAWPRLYEALPETTVKRAADMRNALDTAARLCLSLLLAAGVSAGLLAMHGWWLLAPAAMLALAVVAYRAAVAAARNYGNTVCAIFDVHRLKLLQLMRIEMPPSLNAEFEINRVLTALWTRDALGPGDDLAYGRTDTDIGLLHQRSRASKNNP
jgi:multisubunit Na+/H+ antiporter MnhG subunit